MIGKLISGRYQIIQNLGAGGFGQTFLAEDLQLPDHPKCVVKQLKPASRDAFVLQTASRLFDAEARVLHRLGSHDRIPRLLAHFEEDHEFYLVQELIDGYDLTIELMPTGRSVDGYPVGRMNQAGAIAFLKDLLETLTFVHQQGAIHRDIKPANLMRRRVDRKLVLIDFGAVKQVGTAIATNATAIPTVAIGTDGYMPNEQAVGKPKPCSDLYAVGAIALQGLTGVLPSQLSEDMKTGELAWRMSPSYAALKYRTDVSDDLAKIIDKLVRYDFRDRYQSADEALAAVNQLPRQVPSMISGTISSVLPTKSSTNAQEITIISNFKASPEIADISPTIVTGNHLRPKPKNWLRIGAISLVSAIAVIGAVMFLRPSATLKNAVNINAISPTAKYLFLSERAIDDSDLADKSALELDIMRNEIFARYGRGFKDAELQSYFKSQPWYQPRYEPDKFPEDLLTPTELLNVQFISQFQVRSAEQKNRDPEAINSKCDYTQRLVSDPNPPINVRQGGGKDFPIVGKLDNGAQITVEVEKQGWLKISAPIAGWIAANRTKPICF